MTNCFWLFNNMPCSQSAKIHYIIFYLECGIYVGYCLLWDFMWDKCGIVCFIYMCRKVSTKMWDSCGIWEKVKLLGIAYVGWMWDWSICPIDYVKRYKMDSLLMRADHVLINGPDRLLWWLGCGLWRWTDGLLNDCLRIVTLTKY